MTTGPERLTAPPDRRDDDPLMDAGGIDVVLVTAGQGLVGIVTATDLVRSLAAEAWTQPTGARP
jgi:CBS domain-containing protein